MCFVFLLMVGALAAGEEVLTPVIDGDWWQVAGDPDLGEYTRPEQQPVDFGVWQADDGTWQLWSCIRKTGCGGNTRLFYRWEGQNLTDEHWKPMGIAMEAPQTEYFIGTAEIGQGKLDDDRMGVIESPPFKIEKADYVPFVSGGDDLQNVYVSLVDAQSGEELVRRTGKQDNGLQRSQLDCTAWLGKEASIRIVDQATGPWGHINFGGMYEDPLKLFDD
jgi:hypothetical protein